MATENGDAWSGRELPAIVDASPVPTMVHDAETGAILDVNPACEDLFGYDAEVLCELDVSEFSPSVPEAAARAGDAIERAAATGAYDFDWEVTKADGTRATVHVELRDHTDANAPRVVAYVTDVTEHRKRERALRELPGVAADLMDAETREEIASVTTEAADATIDFSFAGVRLLTDGRLEMASMTADAEAFLADQVPSPEVGEGFVGEAFASGEPQIIDDVSTALDDRDTGPVNSALCIPLGSHGVLTVGGSTVGQFGDSDVAFVKLLTRLTEAALDQVDREDRLQERTDRLETLLNNAPLMFYELDTEGTIVESRGRGLNRIGLDPGEAVGNSIFEMYADVPAVQRIAEMALDGERVSEVVSAGGQWFDNTFQPVFDDAGDVERVVGVAFDVTEQKRVEQQFARLSESAITLSESDGESDAIERAVDVAEHVLGEGVVAYWTAADDPERLTATTISDSASVMAEGSESLTHEPGDPVWNAFEAGETVIVNDFDAEDIDSTAALRSVILAPVGEHGLLTVGRTDLDAFDEENRYLLALLSGLLRTSLDRHQYERALQESKRELERSNESLQQFAYIASHDLQEPLRMVSSYVSLLDDEYGDDLDGEAEQYMEYATDGAARMQQMIDGLLQYSRVHTQGEEFTAVDAEAVFEETLRSLELLVDDADARVDCGPLPSVSADRSQLGQLFQNLVKNAVHHAGEAPSVDVSAERVDAPDRDGTVDGGGPAETGEKWVRFTVADDGPGIPESQHDRIFEIFKRNSSRSDSTGIGLAMCQRIVDRHRGDIWVESEPDEGAAFHFTMPAAESDDTGSDR